MISLRYAPAICGLLALALVPTIIHSYSNEPRDAGPVTSAIPTELAGLVSAPSDRNAEWGKRRFDSDDWMERNYRGLGGSARLTVVRTFDAKRVYHHPELAVAYGTSFVGEQIVRTAERPEIPVHVLTPAPGVSAYASYVLEYDQRFVENPIAFQLRTAGELLFSRRKPMTLFFVFDPDARASDAVPPSAATTVLFAAVDAFVINSP